MTRIRIIYNSVLKRVRLINVITGREITYNQTLCLGKYNPNSGVAVTSLDLDKLVSDIARNYNGEKIYISSYSSETIQNAIESAVKALNNESVVFDSNDSRLVFGEAKDIYKQLQAFGNTLNDGIYKILNDDNSVKGNAIKKIANDSTALRKELDEADVVICVTGDYSTGKSTFINALFGKRLLPRSVNRETAKLCKVKKGDSLKIKFELEDDSEVVFSNFNLRECTLEGDEQHPLLQHITQRLANAEVKANEDSIYSILTSINEYYNTTGQEPIRGVIELTVPYDILGGLKYIVYDTPGAGTSCVRDEQELRNIINAPIKPITILLNVWNTIQKMSVSNLLHAIKENGNMDYVMYVINQVDATSKELLETELKTDIELRGTSSYDNTEVGEKFDMRDGQLFFVSSYGALVANAYIDGINPQSVIADSASAVEEKINSEMGCYYTLDSIGGTKSSKTVALIKKCEAEIASAQRESSISIMKGRTLMVNSGMYALRKSLEEFSLSNTISIKTENLYNEYKRVISTAQEYYNQEQGKWQLSAAQKRQDVQILEGALISKVNNAASITSQYVKNTLAKEYEEAKQDFAKMYDKDNKVVANVEKVKNVLTKTVKKDATNFKELYLKLLYLYKRFDKIVKFNIFDISAKRVTQKAEKGIDAIEGVIDRLDRDYLAIRKRELKRFIVALTKNIQAAIDVTTNLSDETKKSLRTVPTVEPIREFNLTPFDFEQYQEKKMKRAEVKKDIADWYKECLEFRKKSYELEFTKTLETIMRTICEAYCNNMKEVSEQLAGQLQSEIDIAKELAELSEKIGALGELSSQLETIIGNKI